MSIEEDIGRMILDMLDGGGTTEMIHLDFVSGADADIEINVIRRGDSRGNDVFYPASFKHCDPRPDAIELAN